MNRKIAFNDNWLFRCEDLGPKNPTERWGGAKAAAYDFGAVSDTLDDSNWETIELPHDYVRLSDFTTEASNAEGITDIPAMQSIQSRLHAGGCLEPKVAWYRKHFSLPKDDQGKHVFIQFGGVYRACDIYINQMYVGSHTSGYTWFYFDITDYLNKDGENIIAVRVDPTEREGWWYEGGGIYRRVDLLIFEDLMIKPYEYSISTKLNENGMAVCKLDALVSNLSVDKERTGTLFVQVLSDEKVVAECERSFVANAYSDCEIKESMVILAKNVRLWDIENPNLYTVWVQLLDCAGNILYSDESEIGIKKVSFDNEAGFFLNDKLLKIHGLCVHQDHNGVGIGLPDSVLEYRLREMKKMGMNAVRSAHYTPGDRFFEFCDKLGILVFSETRRMSSAYEDIDCFARTVKQGRNHASLLLWGIGNEEINLQHKPQAIFTTRRLKAELRKLDSVHPFTSAIVCWDGKEHFKDARKYFEVAQELDVMGFNYCMTAWDDFHENNPDIPVIVTEINAANSSTRGCYSTDEYSGHYFTLDENNETKCTSVERVKQRFELGEREWKAVAERDYLAGAFLWTGIDYRGEPTPLPWPAVSSFFGILDYCGFRKDSFYYYQAWWTDIPTLHIFASATKAYIYTNMDSVRVYENDELIFEKAVEKSWYVTADRITAGSGHIRAVGMKNGQEFTAELGTVEKSSGKNLQVEEYAENTLSNDNVRILNVSAVDDAGRLISSCCDGFDITVGGGTTLIGAGNGDQGNHINEMSLHQRLFNGRAQIIVKSKDEPDIKVTFED